MAQCSAEVSRITYGILYAVQGSGVQRYKVKGSKAIIYNILNALPGVLCTTYVRLSPVYNAVVNNIVLLGLSIAPEGGSAPSHKHKSRKAGKYPVQTCTLNNLTKVPRSKN